MKTDDEARYELRQGEPDDAPLPRGWGGPRTGAGRPPLPEGPLQRVSVRLPAETIRRLRDHGGGNVSAGIRRLAEEHLPPPD